MKIAIAAAAVTTVLLLLGILLGTDGYQAGMLAAVAFLAWVWVFSESLRHAVQDSAEAAPQIVRVISSERSARQLAAPQPDTSHAAQLEHHRRHHLAALAAIADGAHRDGNNKDADVGECEEA